MYLSLKQIEQLRKEREKNNYHFKIFYFCEELEISRSTYYNWLNGKTSPTEKKLEEMTKLVKE